MAPSIDITIKTKYFLFKYRNIIWFIFDSESYILLNIINNLSKIGI